MEEALNLSFDRLLMMMMMMMSAEKTEVQRKLRNYKLNPVIIRDTKTLMGIAC